MTGVARNLSLAVLATLLPTNAIAQALAPGRWNVAAEIIDLTMPGAPGFLLRMARGRITVSRKRLAKDQGLLVLLEPKAKAQCHIDNQRVFEATYTQILTCSRNRSGDTHITRTGSYSNSGFVGRMTVVTNTHKGELVIQFVERGERVSD